MHPILALVVGGAVLAVGAELLVRGASRVALRFGVSPLVVGLTVVAFGTSAPEMAASVAAGLEGRPGIALGNIVGSNIANIGLILAIAGLIAPLPVQAVTVRRELPAMLLATAALTALLTVGGGLGALGGVALLLGLARLTLIQVRTALQEREVVKDEFAESVAHKGPGWSTPTCAAAIVAGLAALVLGGGLLVDGAIALARTLGVTERVIGLTIVAVGTSLPELAATIVAVVRKEPDVAIGNVVGSNLFNILGIGGVVGIITPVEAPPEMRTLDLPALAIFTIAGAYFLWSGRRLTRLEGVALLLGYAAYVVLVTRG